MWLVSHDTVNVITNILYSITAEAISIRKRLRVPYCIILKLWKASKKLFVLRAGSDTVVTEVKLGNAL